MAAGIKPLQFKIVACLHFLKPAKPARAMSSHRNVSRFSWPGAA